MEQIQRFEFTVDLAWKLLRLMLRKDGIETNTPRATLKDAYRAEWLQDGDGWIDMLEDRNKASHFYDEKISAEIYRKIKQAHFSRLKELRTFSEAKIVA